MCVFLVLLLRFEVCELTLPLGSFREQAGGGRRAESRKASKDIAASGLSAKVYPLIASELSRARLN